MHRSAPLSPLGDRNGEASTFLAEGGPGVDPRFDKPEGLTLKPDGTLVVGFDNDFARVDGRPDNLLTAISL